MVGWVGGRVGSIKIKDHLSPVEIEIGAELGNNKGTEYLVARCDFYCSKVLNFAHFDLKFCIDGANECLH